MHQNQNNNNYTMLHRLTKVDRSSGLTKWNYGQAPYKHFHACPMPRPILTF